MTVDEAIQFFTDDFPEYVCALGPSTRQMAYNKAIEALEALAGKDARWISANEKLQDNTNYVLGFFGGGDYDQLRWFDTVLMDSSGAVFPNHYEGGIDNMHLIAWYQVPEPIEEVENCTRGQRR